MNFIPKSFFGQFRRFANVYFLGQAVLMALGQYTTLFQTPLEAWSMLGVLILMMMFTMAMEARDDLFRHRKDAMVNNKPATILRKQAGRWVQTVVFWHELVVGDIVVVTNKKPFPADLVMLTSSAEEGACYVVSQGGEGVVRKRDTTDRQTDRQTR